MEQNSNIQNKKAYEINNKHHLDTGAYLSLHLHAKIDLILGQKLLRAKGQLNKYFLRKIKTRPL